jgi:hypothetical protein
MNLIKEYFIMHGKDVEKSELALNMDILAI